MGHGQMHLLLQRHDRQRGAMFLLRRSAVQEAALPRHSAYTHCIRLDEHRIPGRTWVYRLLVFYRAEGDASSGISDFLRPHSAKNFGGMGSSGPPRQKVTLEEMN